MRSGKKWTNSYAWTMLLLAYLWIPEIVRADETSPNTALLARFLSYLNAPNHLRAAEEK